jgi:pimeloyl-ACP methyl ester carboxylesterase
LTRFGQSDGSEAAVYWADFGGPTETAKSPVVLVHGLGGSHLNWVLLAPLLAPSRRVYALDLAGFGFSPGGQQSSTVEASAELVARFVDEEVGEPSILVGNSMGGMISLLTAAGHPDLVERLVLLDPAIPTLRRNLDRRVAATFFLYGIPRVGEAFLGQVTARMSDRRRVQDTTNLCFADPSRADPDALEAAVELLAYRRRYAPDAELSYITAARSILRLLGRGPRYAALLASISAPVLLIHGEKDRLVPVAAARTAAATYPGWRSVILPDLGHAPMLEKPQLVARLIDDWLHDDRAGGSGVGG